MSKKNSFFDKVSSIFVEQEDAKKVEVVEEEVLEDTSVPTRKMSMNTPKASHTKVESEIPEQYRRAPISDSPAKVSLQATFNEEFYNHFEKVIEDNDLDGSDYYEFKKTFDALKKTPNMSEIGALQATFSVLKATDPDLTAEHLLTTADFYIGLLDKENEDFLGQLDANLNTEVFSKRDKIQEEQDLQKERLEMIEQIKTEIAESEERANVLASEANAEESKFLGIKANWELTINFQKGNIETDKGNIEKYLITKQ